jgi:hydroxyethylthiazole kinase-like uncharacterized protein yjeF
MQPSPDQVLTVAQMRAAEQDLIDAGSSVEALMDVVGKGAAEWVWRLAAHRPVTLLCGPGNNGGDGYVIAEALRARGGEVVGPAAQPRGEVLVDCLFGSGLTRPLTADHLSLLLNMSRSHRHGVAIDVPSGVDSDTGTLLNEGLPEYDLTLALGAWKPAHFLMPACARMGLLRLVGIGVAPVGEAARVIEAPSLAPPAADAHKYRRGLLGVVAGEMPGASLLAAGAAQRSGAGYVKLLGEDRQPLPSDLVGDARPLAEALADRRWSALLVGPGLGRSDGARGRLLEVLRSGVPAVADADALVLLRPGDPSATIVTPHEGELAAMEQIFGLASAGPKTARAQALARATGAVIVAKGPDSVVAAPDGRLALGHRGSSWLSVAGTGDVLAGIVASRLATGADPFEAACQGLWLHAEAARQCAVPFTAGDLADAIPAAYAAAL